MYEIASQAGAIAFLAGVIVLHYRVRLWSSASLLASSACAFIWFWLDRAIPTWVVNDQVSTGSADVLYTVAPYAGPLVLLWFGLSFLSASFNLDPRVVSKPGVGAG
jgi:hypothetical protein